MKRSSLPTKLPTQEAKNEETQMEEEEVPDWVQYNMLKKALSIQKHKELEEFFQSDLYHPPVSKMMSMPPHAAKKFQRRNSSADWSHVAEPEENNTNGRTVETNGRIVDSNSRTVDTNGKTVDINGRTVDINGRTVENLNKKFSLKDFDLGKVLGKGRFATVYLAREKTRGFIVVLKVIYKSVLAKYQAERAIRSEIEIQAHLKDPNIVQIYGYFHDSDRIYLILEYAMYGDIFNDVQLCRLDEHTAASYTYQVAKALQFMHENYVIHRDIKLENVYLNDSGQIKVGDFGWSVHTHKLKNDKVVGTLHYMAPEMLTPDNELYNHKVDNWALGVLLFEMLCSSLPFYGDTEEDLERRILRAKLKIPPYVSSEAQDLIRRLLEKDPENRIDLVDVMEHPWITKHLAVKSLKYMCLKFVRDTSRFYPYDFTTLPMKLTLEIEDDILFRFHKQ